MKPRKPRIRIPMEESYADNEGLVGRSDTESMEDEGENQHSEGRSHSGTSHLSHSMEHGETPNGNFYREDEERYSEDEEPEEHSESEFSYDDERPSKRTKPCRADRISSLDDSLISHILSMMPVRDAVRTELLSKRWRHLWASSHSLLFSCNYYFDPESFVKFVNTSLMLHKGPKIKNMTFLKVPYSLQHSINLWVNAAVKKEVEELSIELNDGMYYDRMNVYSLPYSLLSCNTLTKLELTAEKINLSSSACWKSLKNLTLYTVQRLTDNMIQRLVDGSPVLESLALIDCSGFDHINVNASSTLRRLVLDGYAYKDVEAETGDALEILAPGITTLEILGLIRHERFRLTKVSSLVQVNLGFSMFSPLAYWYGHASSDISKQNSMYQRMLRDLLNTVSHVKKLSIGTWCTQVLSISELRRKTPPVSLQCKCLVLNTLYERDLPGIARLLQISPLLERLVIDSKSSDCCSEVETCMEFSGFKGKSYLKSQDKAFKNSFKNLKIVEFVGCFHLRFISELAELLLEHAEVLEKMICKPGGVFYLNQQRMELCETRFFKIVRKLLSYSRSSTQAKILLL